MQKIALYILVTVLFAFASNAQTLNGKVLAKDNNQPVGSASVYLSNTSIGTTTNVNGEFTLTNFPSGRYELIVSCIGYEPYQLVVNSNNLLPITIYLKPRVKELEEVTVEPYEKSGWEKYGKSFLDWFIGKSAFASDCRIKNTEVIRFRFRRKENKLEAYAYEPLIIINEALGYEIKYDLTKFEYNYGSGLLYFGGYPFFVDMETKRKGKIRRWDRKRAETYQGSLMHFMRALYRNKISDEGFEVRQILREFNNEKKRVQAILKNRMKGAAVNGSGKIVFTNGNISLGGDTGDSSTYYNRIMREPDTKEILINQLLPGDSIAYAFDSVTAALDFKELLQIIYRGKSEPDEYIKERRQAKANPFIESRLELINKRPVAVIRSGLYYEGADLISYGYWAFSEKMATMLPYDYKPPKKNK